MCARIHTSDERTDSQNECYDNGGNQRQSYTEQCYYQHDEYEYTLVPLGGRKQAPH